MSMILFLKFADNDDFVPGQPGFVELYILLFAESNKRSNACTQGFTSSKSVALITTSSVFISLSYSHLIIPWFCLCSTPLTKSGVGESIRAEQLFSVLNTYIEICPHDNMWVIHKPLPDSCSSDINGLQKIYTLRGFRILMYRCIMVLLHFA